MPSLRHALRQPGAIKDTLMILGILYAVTIAAMFAIAAVIS